MSKTPASLTAPPQGYAPWLAALKERIHAAQQRAALAVNRELVLLYWHIGRDILQRQTQQGWGSKVIERLAHDLKTAFPDMKGFSRANLMYMRAFAQAWPEPEIVQQAVGQLPWGHNLVLLTKLKQTEQRLAYAQRAIEHGWSRNVLVMQIETGLLERSGQALTNFAARLPAPQSDLARESLKDPYRFDFLGLAEETHERDIEQALVKHVTEFLLELGAGFAFVGRQVHLEIGGDDFYIDLLFYHLKLRCYVVIELKSGAFKPEPWPTQLLPHRRRPASQIRSRPPQHRPAALQKQKQSGGRVRPGRQKPTHGHCRIPIGAIPSQRTENQPAQH